MKEDPSWGVESMSVRCGVCGNRERFGASAKLVLDVTVDCAGGILETNLASILENLVLKPESCSECGAKRLVESEIISDKEWEAQIDQALSLRQLQEDLDRPALASRRGRSRAS